MKIAASDRSARSRRRGRLGGARRWLALTLAVAFAVASLIHASGGDLGAPSPERGHRAVAAMHQGHAPCLPFQDHGAGRKNCAAIAGCALCGLPPIMALAAPPASEPVSVALTIADDGAAVAPRIRPPKRFVRL